MNNVSDELKTQYDVLMDTMFAYARSQCLFTAIELDVFTQLEGQSLDREALRRRIGVHERAHAEFFDTLVALGCLVRSGSTYTNSAMASRYLVRDRPLYLGDLMNFVAARLYPVWRRLPEAMRTGSPQNEAQTEADYYANLGRDEQRLETFLKGMTGLSARPAVEIASRIPWSRYHSFVDLGGALGVVADRIIECYPHLEGSVFELPGVRPLFEAARIGTGSRVRFHPGDFFADALPRTDVFIMGHVLHNWSPSQKAQLVARAADALNPGGALVIYEDMLDDQRTRVLALLDALNMLLVTRTGGSVTVSECHGLLRGAGLRGIESLIEESAISIVVGWKA
jgi:hypothetical protein